MSCGVGRRHGSDLALLWLWCRLAAVALLRPLAWEPLYAMHEALKSKKQKIFYADGNDRKAGVNGVPIVAQWLTNPTRNHEVVGSILASINGLRIRCCHELWGRLQTQL